MAEYSMKIEPISFRPRNGLCAEAYYRIRYWGEEHGFSFSDVINAILPALNYYLHNHCLIDHEKSKATVDLNIGPVDILHVVNGKCYPLASETNTTKKILSQPELRERIDYWTQQNKQLGHSDLLLLNHKNVKKGSKSKRTNTV